MRILGWAAGADGCAFYRVEMPLRMMRLRGHETKWDEAWRGVGDPDWQQPHTLIAQRMGNIGPSKQWQSLCESGLMRCILELDDDIWNVDESSAARGWRDLDMQLLVNVNITAAHAVTTTTPRLAEIIGDMNPNVHVIPNTVPRFLLDAKPAKHKGVNVGWGGSSTHAMDFVDTAAAISRTVARHGWARLVLTGSNYVGTGRHIETRPWLTRVPEWWRSLADIDIGIAPLADHVFNESKSPIKILEYASRGIPVVASNVGPYRDNVIHGEMGFLCDTAKDWEHYLSLLIRDEALRHRMGEKARQWASNFTIEGWAKAWEEVYLHGD